MLFCLSGLVMLTLKLHRPQHLRAAFLSFTILSLAKSKFYWERMPLGLQLNILKEQKKIKYPVPFLSSVFIMTLLFIINQNSICSN